MKCPECESDLTENYGKRYMRFNCEVCDYGETLPLETKGIRVEIQISEKGKEDE